MDIGIARTDIEREATYRFLNDEFSAQNSLLVEEARSIDTKATFVAGFAAAALPFFLGNPRGTLWWLALGAYMTSFVVALAALWPRRWDRLRPRDLQAELAEGSPIVVVGEVAGTKVVIYERNSGRVRNKAIIWTISVGILAVGITFSVWSTIVEAVQ